jgi:hypothetical protein
MNTSSTPCETCSCLACVNNYSLYKFNKNLNKIEKIVKRITKNINDKKKIDFNLPITLDLIHCQFCGEYCGGGNEGGY